MLGEWKNNSCYPEYCSWQLALDIDGFQRNEHTRAHKTPLKKKRSLIMAVEKRFLEVKPISIGTLPDPRKLM